MTVFSMCTPRSVECDLTCLSNQVSLVRNCLLPDSSSLYMCQRRRLASYAQSIYEAVEVIREDPQSCHY